jgi:hypothetical protein
MICCALLAIMPSTPLLTFQLDLLSEDEVRITPLNLRKEKREPYS